MLNPGYVRKPLSAGPVSVEAVCGTALDSPLECAETVIWRDTGIDMASSACAVCAFVGAAQWAEIGGALAVGREATFGGGRFVVHAVIGGFSRAGELVLVRVLGAPAGAS